MLWKEQRFLTCSRKAVANRTEIWDLLDTVQLPKEIAVVHCPAHTRGTNIISRGNALADAAVKATARQPVIIIMVVDMDRSSWPGVNHPEKLY